MNKKGEMKIKVATAQDADAISSLRKQAYRLGSKTELSQLDFLEWSPADDQALILAVESPEGELVSSIRLSISEDQKGLEQLFDIRLQQKLNGPILLLDKLTTLPNYRRLGLSALLRYHILHFATASDIRHIAFTINYGVSRMAHLLELGFNLQKADISHRQTELYQNDTDVLLGTLHASNFKLASELAFQNLRQPFQNLEFTQQDEAGIQRFKQRALLEA